MRLLQRRLFLEFTKVFLLALAVLLLFILMARAIQLRDMLFGLEPGILDSLRLFACLSPLFLLMICPVACMIAVFLTFLRMSTDREIVALRAGGVSLYQLLPAPVLFSLLCMLLGLWLSLFWQAWGMSRFRASVLELAGNSARLMLHPGVFNKEIPGMIFFARRVDQNTGAMAQVLMEDRSRSGGILTILAPEGGLDTDYARGELLLLLKNGRIYTEQKSRVTVLGFDEYIVRLPLDSLFKGLDLGPLKPSEMEWKELAGLSVPDILPVNPRLGHKITVERHKRWIFPAACLALSVFVIPLAVSFQGMRRQNGLLLALLLFLAYYSFISLGISLGESGTLSPLLGLWLPNALFLAMGIAGIRLAAEERMPRILENARRRRPRTAVPAAPDPRAKSPRKPQ
jgi:lipopolysaccharide export system permease protein